MDDAGARHKVVAGHQPNFFPWFGYFEKMACCDVFVFSDDVQYPRANYVNRVEIPVGSGSMQWALPVLKGGDQRIADKCYLKDEKTFTKMLRSISVNLGGMPCYGDVSLVMEEFTDRFWALDGLSELNRHMILFIAERIGITTPTVRGSELGLDRWHATERLIKRLELLGADTYLSGQGAHSYTDLDMFAESGRRLTWITYSLGPRLLGSDLKYSILVGIGRLGFARLRSEMAAFMASRQEAAS